MNIYLERGQRREILYHNFFLEQLGHVLADEAGYELLEHVLLRLLPKGEAVAEDPGVKLEQVLLITAGDL